MSSSAASGLVKGRTLLVVDDDDDILLIVDTLLRSAGFEVLLARHGGVGIAVARSRQPSLILLDVMMPELSGWEVCATLKNLEETSHIPVVMLTVKAEIRDLVTGMQVGADDYVGKPFSKKKLVDTVERVLAGAPGGKYHDFMPREMSDPRAKNLLFDGVTGLPTIPVIVDALREKLLVDREVGVLFVDIEKYSHIEDFYGWEVFDEVIGEAGRGLKRLLGTLFATEDLLAINRPSGSEFYIFLSVPSALSGEAILERLEEGPAARRDAQGPAQRDVPAPHPPEDRPLRRVRPHPPLAAGEAREARVPRPPRRDPHGLLEGGRARCDSEGAVPRHPEKRARRDALPAHHRSRDGGDLRARGAHARAQGLAVREPRGAVRLRLQDRPGVEPREDLHGQRGAAFRGP
jgi:DNA-binding response OmpR family regulator